MHPASTRSKNVLRLARLGLVCGGLLGLTLGCGRRLDLPAEPDSGGGPAGEVAYVKKYAWDGFPPLRDIVLTNGQLLYGIDDTGRVRSWFSDTSTPRENTSRNLPAEVVVGPDTLRAPVQLCEGFGTTLWVAYSQPRPTLLQWNVGVVPAVPVDSGLVQDPAFRRFGGITADTDSNIVYVADDSVSTITKYAPSRTGGHRIATLASQGNGDHFVQQPHGLFAFGDSLLVADTGKNWLQVLSSHVPFTGRGQVAGTDRAAVAIAQSTRRVDGCGRLLLRHGCRQRAGSETHPPRCHQGSRDRIGPRCRGASKHRRGDRHPSVGRGPRPRPADDLSIEYVE